MSTSRPDDNLTDPKEEIVTYLPAMRAFALSLTRNSASADDLVQDTIVKAWSNFDKFQEGTNLRAWLFTILRNTFYSTRRKQNREVADVDGAFAETLSCKPEHDGKMAFTDFKEAFDTLPDDQRETLWLVGALGMSYEEAAQTCGCAVGTIKSRTNRAREKLAEILDLNGENFDLTDQSTLSVINSNLPVQKQ